MKKHLIWGLVFWILSSHVMAQRAEEYTVVSKDGAWCWFSDPRAIEHNGKLYNAWTASNGDITIGVFDYRTGAIDSTVIAPAFQNDDHTVPSLLFLPDGRLMAFFNRHNGGLYYTTSLKPEDISFFEKVRFYDLGKMFCYTNPVLLPDENNRIYVFSRGGYDWKPSYIYSDDLGKTWSKPVTFVAKPGAPHSNRPYTKVVSDGKAAIYFAFTDGHPRDEICNSIYYLKYEHGKFFDAAGSVIGDTARLPIDQNTVSKVYDGVKTRIRAWIWDIAIDPQGRPAMVYATFPEDALHVYNYACWDGTQWQNHRICLGGSWFPRYEKKKEDKEPEPHYSGGLVLDHRNPATVYLAKPVNDRFEIFRYVTKDQGKSWDSRPLTVASDYDNVRPFVVRGHVQEDLPDVLWMNVLYYHHYTDFKSRILGNRPGNRFSAALEKEDVKKVMQAVAVWQISHFDPPRHHPLDWTNGALYAGMFAWSQLSSDPQYLNWLIKIGKKYQWQPGFRMYHADDFVVTQTFIDIYRIKKDERMLMPVKDRVWWVMNHPSHASLDFRNFTPYTTDRWSWCDALFMAPPVYAKLYATTGDKDYMKFMDKEFKATYEYLYDKKEHLFYRDSRYFDKWEANGQKVFWGRGNGWVMGGLVRIMQELPAGNKYRTFYEQLLKEMAAKVAALQDENGYWHASLLDPESYPNPETSSSGFFTYALAWGINNGLLDKEQYLPVVKKGWHALVRAVYPDGKVGWVQPVGADPKKVTREMTEVYGVGAFLLAGSEVYKIAGRQEQKVQRPNILFCLADDAAFPHMGAYGTRWVRTPGFDRVAEQGILFTRAYTPNAKCAPSRACIITGRNSWQLGAAANHWCYFPKEYKTYPEVLTEHGYYVGYTGKGWAPGVAGTMDGKPRRLVGQPWQKIRTIPPTNRMSGTDYFENFRAFLESKPADEPFCFWYGGHEPHRGYEFGSGIEKGGKHIRDIDNVYTYWPDVDSVRTDMLDYAFEIEYFDSHLVKMLDLLAQTGQLDNTIVVVTGDNGMPFPRCKGQGYEQSNHMPLAIMWKKGIINPGRTVDDFVSFIDFTPTFLEVAGVDPATSGMAPVTGRSLTAIFAAPEKGIIEKDRDHVLIGKERHDVGRPHDKGYPIRGIVRDQYLFIHNFKTDRWPAGNPETGYLNCDGSPTKTVILNEFRTGENLQHWVWSFGKRPADELYNIKKDPDCIVNLARKPEYAGVVTKLKTQLFTELKEEGDPRMFGKGDVFDEYPYADTKDTAFYERYMRGEKLPVGWVNKTDFETDMQRVKEVLQDMDK